MSVVFDLYPGAAIQAARHNAMLIQAELVFLFSAQ
jgi:hypothetical protein